MGYTTGSGIILPRMAGIKIFRIWAVALVLATGLATMVSCDENVYEAISSQGDLSQFRELINEDEVLRKMLELWSVTLFVPTDEAFHKNRDWIHSTNVKFVSYHVLNLVANKTSFPFAAATSLPGGPPLYLGIKSSSHAEKEYFANNAKIIRTDTYHSKEGAEQLLYVIDDVLRPYQGKPFPPMDAYNLIQLPDSFNVRQSASTFFSRLKEEGLQSLFEREGNHTFFIPIDPAPAQSSRIKQSIDSWVIRGHVIPRNLIFTRLSSPQDTYRSDAYDNEIHIELSIFDKITQDHHEDHSMYAQSNTMFSSYGHKKGIVRARIVQGNIPVKNGVVHFIEQPLIVISNSIWDYINSEEDPRLEEFRNLLNRAPEFQDLLMSDEDKTLFAPSNDAIRQIPQEIMKNIKNNVTAITKLLKLHLVKSTISSDDVYFDRALGCMSRGNCNSLKFRVVGSEHNKTLIVVGNVVQAAAIQSDIGAVDGIIHIVDRVLGVPFQTVYNKLQTDPDLRITFDLGEQDAWGELLDKHGKHYTFFAPNNEAWANVRHHMPTEYKQLTMGSVPYHVHKVLDRHLVINKELILDDDAEDSIDVQMVHGKFKIRKQYRSGKTEFVIDWEGLTANVVQPNLKTINGVIHVIDGVMLKKRDLTKSSAVIPYSASSTLLTILASVIITTTSMMAGGKSL